MIYAIDFDGTIVENSYPKIGSLRPEAELFIRSIKANGNQFILWTCRTGALLDEAVRFLREHDIAPDYVNENTPESIEHFGNDSRKIFADIYIDDRNCGGLLFPAVRIVGGDR